MVRLGLASLLLVGSITIASAQTTPVTPPPEIVVPTPLIEQIYAYLQTKPYADVALLIDGLRQAVAKTTKPDPHGPAAPPASPQH